MKLILGAIALIIIASAISKQSAATGWDFQAYYKAGARVLAGGHPYVFEHDYPYKYGPATVAVFLPFQAFKYDTARWVYCALHILAALFIPFVNFLALQKSRDFILPKSFFWSLVIGFVASLRFLDGEFQTSQISLWIYLFTVVSALLLASDSRKKKYLGIGILAMVSQLKIHSTVMWYALTKKLFNKKNLWLLTPAIILYLLPNPAWWLEWARQIKETTPLIPATQSSINRQGFFGFAVLVLKWREYGLGPWILSLPFALYAAIRLPKFNLTKLAPQHIKPLLLSLLAWMLWGFMASPLPWQHTYSLLWGVIPLMWISSSQKLERILILVISFALAASPKGILGEPIAKVFESHQGPFLLILGLWFLLVHQARAKFATSQNK